MDELIHYTVIMERVKDDIDYIAEQAYERGKRDILEQLQTVQPELIRCKDCKYNGECSIQYVAYADGKFFCGAGEQNHERL